MKITYNEVLGFLIAIIFLVSMIGVIGSSIDSAIEETKYEKTCNKCEIINIKSASAGGFGHRSEYIYETKCGTILTHERADVGDSVCRGRKR